MITRIAPGNFVPTHKCCYYMHFCRTLRQRILWQQKKRKKEREKKDIHAQYELDLILVKPFTALWKNTPPFIALRIFPCTPRPEVQWAVQECCLLFRRCWRWPFYRHSLWSVQLVFGIWAVSFLPEVGAGRERFEKCSFTACKAKLSSCPYISNPWGSS